MTTALGPVIVSAVLAATSLRAAPAPGTDWVRTWNGPSGGVDQGAGGVPLPGGGFVMVGEEQAPGQGSNAAIRVYDTAGTLLWSRSWNPPANSNDTFFSCAVNPAGTILAAGWETRTDLGQGTNWRLVAYDATGATLWTRTLNGGASGDDYCYGVTADSSGNFLVAGSTAETASGLDWMLRKYDANGGLLWATTYNDPYTSSDEATAVTVDTADNVLVAGWSVRSASYIHDWVIRKYDPAGVLLWSRTWGSPATASDDRPGSVTSDPAGNVYVAGFENRGDLGQNHNWRVLKFDANGTLLVKTTHNGSANGNDEAHGLVSFPDGGFAAAGWQAVSGQGDNWLIIRWDALGSILWSVTYNHPSNGTDHAWNLRRSDAEPDVLYVPGWETNGTVDWRLTKLRQVATTALSGDLSISGTTFQTGAWFESVLTVTNTGTGSAWTVAPSVMTAGTAPLTLIAGPAPSTTTIESGATRFFTWTWSCAGAGSISLTASATGIDGGNFLASGIPASTEAGLVWAPSPTAPPPPFAWNWMLPAPGYAVAMDVAADSCNNLLVSGWDDASGVGRMALRKISPAGALLWTHLEPGAFGLGTEGAGVCIGPDDSIYLSGRVVVPGEDANWFLRKLTRDGGTVWTRSYNGQANGFDFVKAVATLPGGDVVAVGGVLRSDLGEGWNWRAARHRSSDGAVLWATSYHSGFDSGDGDVATSVVVDPAGDLIVVGIEHYSPGPSGWRIVKYAPDGTVRWSRSYVCRAGNLDARVAHVAVNAAGDLFIAGYDLVTAWPDYDFVLCKFDGTGNLVWQRIHAGAAGGTDEARSVSVAPDGTIIAAGIETVAGQGRNWVARAYDSGGALAWSITLNGSASGDDEVNGVAADRCGNLVIVGGQTTAGNAMDWLVRRHAAGPDCGCVPTGSTPPPPVEPVTLGDVKIVGGVRGYINPKQGERATILLRPETPGPVIARIYDRSGVLVREMTGLATGGRTIVLHWDATDASGVTVPPGIYPILITGPGIRYTDKLAVLR